MKRTLLVFLVVALFVLSFGNAFAAGPAPQFGITTGEVKLGDGDTWKSDYHGMIVDGTYVYSVRVYPERVGGGQEVVMDKSNDGGLTWQGSTGITRGSDIDFNGASIAINPVTKALHYIWITYDPFSVPHYNYYYGNGTVTTRVNGSSDVSSDSGCIAVDGNGVIHIVFLGSDNAVYYTSSSDTGVTFSGPVPVPTDPVSYNMLSFTADSAGSLYLLYGSGGKFMKKTAGGSWSASYAACQVQNDTSMVVYDSTHLYFAGNGTIGISTNGGQTWTCHATPFNVTGANDSLAVSGGLLNYAWGETDGVHFVRTTKSNDPTSWGTPALAIPGGNLPNIAVDPAGKAYITAQKEGMTVFTKEK